MPIPFERFGKPAKVVLAGNGEGDMVQSVGLPSQDDNVRMIRLLRPKGRLPIVDGNQSHTPVAVIEILHSGKVGDFQANAVKTADAHALIPFGRRRCYLCDSDSNVSSRRRSAIFQRPSASLA